MAPDKRPPTDQDLRVLAWQIGRPPQGVLAVVRSCSYGFPQVIQSHPLRRGSSAQHLGSEASPFHQGKQVLPPLVGGSPREGEGEKQAPLTPTHGGERELKRQPWRDAEEFVFFPTLFWLTCPFLNAAVSRLETRGDVKRWEARLQQDPELKARYLRAHESYRRERNALLAPEDWAFLQAHAAVERTTTGIAGLENFERVKCLHAQLAHFLARGENPIGQGIAQELKQLECPPDNVLCRQAL